MIPRPTAVELYHLGMYAKPISRPLLRGGLFALALSGFAAAASLSVTAQQPAAGAPTALTAADYARAEKFMAYNTTPLVLHSGVRPTWLPDDRFWYRTTTEKGSEAVLIDPASATRSACDLPACLEASGEGGRGGGRGGAPLSYARSPDGKQRRRSSATGICGCATSRPARKRS